MNEYAKENAVNTQIASIRSAGTGGMVGGAQYAGAGSLESARPGSSLSDAAKSGGENLNHSRENRQILERILIKLRGNVPMPEEGINKASPPPSELSLNYVLNGLAKEQRSEISKTHALIMELSNVLGEL